MQKLLLTLLTLALCLFSCLLYANSNGLEHPKPRSTFEESYDPKGDAVTQIQTHLRRVVAHLKKQDTKHLSKLLLKKREAHITRLQKYLEEGVFPRNRHFLGVRPVFIDYEGRACAVADLMIHSGSEEAARDISERENYSYVPDMKSPALLRWVKESGLTAEECAMIQPGYHCDLIQNFQISANGNDIEASWEEGIETDPSFERSLIITRDGIEISHQIFEVGAAVTLSFQDLNLDSGVYTYRFAWYEPVPSFCQQFIDLEFNHRTHFLRGDSNQDGAVDLADAINTLSSVFEFLPNSCIKTMDANADHGVDLADVIYLLTFLYSNGAQPPAPFPGCGEGPSNDLDCQSFGSCP